MDKLKQKKLIFIAAAMLIAFALSSCIAQTPEGEHVDLNDPLNGEDIMTAAELISFINEGESNTASLAASIDIGEELLSVSRSPITIIGNGYTLSGSGDCVLRLSNGCELTLEDITITAGGTGIGCLGNASVSGSAGITAIAHAIDCEGSLSIGRDSDLKISSSVGNAIYAERLSLEADASVSAEGGLGAVAINNGDIVLREGSALEASTLDNYNALKCDGTLEMYDGARLGVSNEGEYHGAEISELFIEGTTTIEAHGGSKGVGLFLFSLEEDYYCLGYCEPEARFEVGSGSLTFVDSEADFPQPGETAALEEDTGTED